MAALSTVLNSVRMTSAIFADSICHAPWGFAVPPMEFIARVLAPGTERVVGYHLVIAGKALIGIEGTAELPLKSGDIVILPHGDAHTISNGAPSALIDSGAALDRWLKGNRDILRFGHSGGEATHFMCGYFGCERHAARLFLTGLPPLIKMNIRCDAAGRWLESSIRHLRDEAASKRPGRMSLLSKMAEALFIEALRRYMEQLPPGASGWLAGARDPVVGSVLALLHREPRHRWTLAELAHRVGSSRSVVAERFAQFLGEPPLTYLARWRLQLAARLLQTTQDTILHVAMAVGYESESGFNRAFKREFGLPPAQYRRQRTTERAPTASSRGSRSGVAVSTPHPST